VLVVQRVFRTKRTNLHEKYGYPVKKMRARLNRPPQSAAELIATLERSGLPASAAHLRQAQALI
jgi:hypothetical protein